MKSFTASAVLFYLANIADHVQTHAQTQASADSDGIILNAMEFLRKSSSDPERKLHATPVPAPTNSNGGGNNNGGGGVMDDPSFHFPLVSNGSTQHCSWIANNASSRDYRRATYCVDPNIMGSCPISCGTNPIDDPDFEFSTNNGFMQSCSWLTASQSAMVFRRSNYCPTVGTFCPESCGYFPMNSFPSPGPPGQGTDHSHPTGGVVGGNPFGGVGGGGIPMDQVPKQLKN